MSADDATTRDRQALVEQVCERIAQGESVSAIFRSAADSLPRIVTFWRWLHDDPELEKLYERATAQRGEKYADEIVDIIDGAGSPLLDDEGRPILGRDGFPVMVVDRTAVEHAKARADARKWTASRLLPKRYGDRTTIAGDAENPIAIVDQSAIASKLLPELAAAGATAAARDPDTD